MILDEQTPLLDKTLEAQTLPPASEPEPAAPPESAPPPPYAYHTAATAGDGVKRRPRTCRDIVLKLAILVLLLCSMVGVSLATVRVVRVQRKLNLEARMSQYGYVKVTDGDITSCSRVSDWTPLSPISRRPHPPSVAFSHTSFRIPRDSESLSFFKRGPMRPGSFEVDVDPDLPEDVINVTFHALYTPSALVSSSSYVCLLQNGEGNLTLGIYATPSDQALRDEDLVSYIITVYIPVSPRQQLLIERLATDLPDFSHALGDLGGAAWFGSVELKTTNESMTALSLAANAVHFQNVDGDIEGVFDVAQALDLASETGKIECKVNLRTRGAELYPNSSMQLFSRHGNVSAIIGLSSAAQLSKSTYDFVLGSETGSFELEFSEAPLASTLRVNISTHQGNVALALPPRYEGPYWLNACTEPAVFRRAMDGDSALKRDLAAPFPRAVDFGDTETRGASRLGTAAEPHPAPHGRWYQQRPPVTDAQGFVLIEGLLWYEPFAPQRMNSYAIVHGNEVMLVT